jgi:NAD/NADP transhydrogenase beta subunit
VIPVCLLALTQNSDFVTACYIVAFSLFISGSSRGTHPHGASRQPEAAAGMVAVAITLSLDVIGNGILILIGILIGTAVGAFARTGSR